LKGGGGACRVFFLQVFLYWHRKETPLYTKENFYLEKERMGRKRFAKDFRRGRGPETSLHPRQKKATTTWN